MSYEYYKIDSIFKCDPDTKMFIEGSFSIPEFEYIFDNLWVATEKIDGTNIRVTFNKDAQLNSLDLNPSMLSFDSVKSIRFGGKTDKAQIPPYLSAKLQELFPLEKFEQFDNGMTLYGEGFGEKIQKGGGKYMPNGKGCYFILFDVRVGNWWLKREYVEQIADKLGIKVVPIIGVMTLREALETIKLKDHITSSFGNKDFPIEGFVLKPKIELFSRNGQRIITKIKYVDFKGKDKKRIKKGDINA